MTSLNSHPSTPCMTGHYYRPRHSRGRAAGPRPSRLPRPPGRSRPPTPHSDPHALGPGDCALRGASGALSLALSGKCWAIPRWLLGGRPLAPPASARLLSRMRCRQAGPPACVLVHTQSYAQLPEFCFSGGCVALPVGVLPVPGEAE